MTLREFYYLQFMEFIEGETYHIYNRGNNRQKIFFNEENYLFFLRKMKKELSPYCDVLAYCLMPNHFHIMITINTKDRIERVKSWDDSTLTPFEPTQDNLNTQRKTTLNHGIAILLRSYTRAIQNQKNITGSLFQQKTKALLLNNSTGSGINHPAICLHYIHQNPLSWSRTKNGRVAI